MKNYLEKYKLLPLLFILLLTACGGPKEDTVALTSVAQTMQVIQIQSTAIAETILGLTKAAQDAVQPVDPATSTPIPAASSDPLLPTITSAFTQPTAANNPVPAGGSASSSGDRAEFVSETIPDDTKFSPGATFTKTWQLVNKGSTTWTTSYALVFSSGDQLGEKTIVYIPYPVEPNQVVDISVAMKAPNTNGTYKSDWVMRNATGQDFGIGSAGVNPVWVQIKVETGAAVGTGTVSGAGTGTATPTITGTVLSTNTPTPTSTATNSSTFAVTDVLIDLFIVNPSGAITCGTTVDLIPGGKITTNSSGTITYEWVLDGNSKGPTTLEFTSALSQPVPPPSGGGWSYNVTTDGQNAKLELKVTAPNAKSDTMTKTFPCTP